MKQQKTTLVLAAVLVVLAGVYYFAVYNKTSSTIDETDTQFAVKDTAHIERIKIAKYLNDEHKETIELTRNPKGGWLVNGKQNAQQSRMTDLMEAIYRVELKDFVSPSAQKTAHERLKQAHLRVDIYNQNGNEKTYFVGGSAQDDKGTIMLMSRSATPYITEIPGFPGYLTPRYETALDTWVEIPLFDASLKTLKSVSVNYADKNASFTLSREPNRFFKLTTPEPTDSFFILKYLENYKRTFALAYADKAYPGKLAELKKQPEFAVLTVENLDGTRSVIHLYENDLNNYFAWIEGKDELLIVQKFVVDKFLVKRSLFWPLSMKLK